ncbi:MAG: hypothetical protein KJ648_07140 [Candidatus Omnitrophica bacterium]|nr:hypothetical protein [Candidatus Omnitrophota bacterium]
MTPKAAREYDDLGTVAIMQVGVFIGAGFTALTDPVNAGYALAIILSTAIAMVYTAQLALDLEHQKK